MGKDRYTMSCLGVTYLALVSATTLVLGNLQYMVMVPYVLPTEIPVKICLLLRYLNETVTVSASLQHMERNLIDDLVIDKDLFHCISFTLPRSLSSKSERYLSVMIKGSTHEFHDAKKVLIQEKGSLIFIQTDKQIYTPGQSVKFRIVSMDEKFYPLHEVLPLVLIEDPEMNRIMQWQNVELENGLTQLSFTVSSEPIKGSYKIVIMKQSGEKTEHSFTVEEYVLPKFEVQVKVPKLINILDTELNVSVCGIYSYRKPVSGNVTLRIEPIHMVPAYYFKNYAWPTYEEVNQPLDIHGCITRQLNTNVFHLKTAEFKIEYLHVEAKITEEGTGLEIYGTGKTYVTKIITSLTFVKVDSYFRRGIPFTGQVRLVDRKGTPIPNERIFIDSNAANHHSNAITDEHGLAQFSIDTMNVMSSSLSVRVYHKHQSSCSWNRCWREEYQDAYRTVYHVFSLSNNAVKLEAVAGILPCNQIQTIQAHYILNEQALGELKEMTFYYLIMAKGNIRKTGTYNLSMKAGESSGHFSMSFPVEAEFAPAVQLLIYAILPDGEVIGDKAKYEIENCLSNKVDLSFNPTQSLPASQALLQVTASPHSLCAVRAVDQSVLLKKPEAELSATSIYNLLPKTDRSGLMNSLSKWQKDDKDCVKRDIVHNDDPNPTISRSEEQDIYIFIRDMNLVAFTNLKLKHPKFCSKALIMYSREKDYVVFANAPPSSIVTVRKYFPETWIWDLVTINSSGVAELRVTVPDTITEWKAGVFCLSNNTGFGISPTASLRAFQPFFLEVTMPYSVIRGEAFTLKATVFNYVPKCIQVSVQLAPSPDYMAIPVEKEESHCLCTNGRLTVSWLVIPKSLGNVNFTVSAETVTSSELCGAEVATLPENGRRDTVVKLLLVEPEGIKKEHTFISLLCASDDRLPEQLSLTLPPKIVEESTRASFSVFGDILSSAIKNTQNLLQMPFGCGEQNMVLFAPNIYVLKYLNETQQVTEEIKSKAIGYLHAGYQRQLNYKHKDGSYSAFGDKDGKTQGNTWLTAFVLKTLAQAQAVIFIDENHISEALIWLSRKQTMSGCFSRSGTLLNNALKGGVQDEVTLSAYITIALLEIPLPVTNPVVQKALTCLESFWNKTKEKVDSHVYTKALLAYAFALAGDQDKRREILKSLDEDAIKEDNTMHWESPHKPRAPKNDFHTIQASSAEVEMTSYVLLAYLTTRSALTSEDLTSATYIVKWLTKQQNPYGGILLHPVVALQALSRYGAATFAKSEKDILVTIQSSKTFSTKFQVNSTNRLLLQQVSLPDLPGEYSIQVSGEGCVYTQAVLKYNVFLEKKESAFILQAQTVPQICDGPESHKSFQISLEVSYIGNRPVSNMVIVDVKMISGFIPLKPTVKMLEKSSSVSRTEVTTNNVLIYVEQVTNQTLSFSFMVVQDIPVRDLKPAIVKVYDYYETDEVAFAEYNDPCSTNSEQGNN